MSLDGTRLLVVGASAGIGRRVALLAAKAGAQVAVAARRRDRLEALVADMGRGHAVPFDATDEDQVRAGVPAAAEALGGLDAVVIACGMATMRPTVDHVADEWRQMLTTNVIGPALVASAALGHLSDRGVVLFTSSSNTHRRMWGLSGYGTSKAALDRMIAGLRDENPQYRFVCASLGPTIGTEFGDEFQGEILGEAMPRWIVSGQMTRGMMPVEELAAVVVDLLATLAAHPEVDIPRIDLDPPGGIVTAPATPDVLTHLFPSP